MARKDKDKEQEMPAVGKKPTRDDLVNAIEAAKEAAHGAEVAAEAALAGLAQERENNGNGGTRIVDISDEEMEAGPLAFEAFMDKLADVFKRYADRIKVTELGSWMKIEGLQGHKVYITKTKTVVNRVESTLDPDLIRGATPMSGNGRIASVLPPNTKAVAEAVKLLATLKEAIRPPARGGGRNER